MQNFTHKRASVKAIKYNGECASEFQKLCKDLDVKCFDAGAWPRCRITIEGPGTCDVLYELNRNDYLVILENGRCYARTNAEFLLNYISDEDLKHQTECENIKKIIDNVLPELDISEILTYLRADKKINAIKYVRDKTRIGLKSSKYFVNFIITLMED